MVDLTLAVFLLAAAIASIRVGYRLGTAAAGGCALLLAIESTLPLLFPVRPLPVGFAFSMLFLGPSSLPNASGLPGAGLLSDPSHHALPALVVGGVARGAFTRASGQRPESPQSRGLDAAGLRLLAVAIILGLWSIAGALGHVSLPPE